MIARSTVPWNKGGNVALFLDAVSDLLLEDLSSHNSSIVG